MKRLFYSLAIIAAVTACNEEMKESDSPVNGEGKTFTAKFEGSKVYMGEDYYYRWQAGDLVSVFTDASHDQYKAVTGDVTETDLEFVSTTAALETTLDKSYAVYPYNAANALEDGVVYTEIAAEQTYSPNGLGNAIMVSETSGSEFVFKNACALVKVNLTIAEDFTNLHAVKSIRVSSKSKSLSGAATINVAGGDYAAKMATQTLAAENAVTLVGCEEAGLLQADKALTFYLAIPAGTYEAGDLTVSVLTNTQSTPFNQAFTLTKNYTVNRSQYIEVTATIAKGYQWFTGDGEEITIKENVVLTNKAIMTYEANLIKQGFDDQYNIETVFDVPDHGINIKGQQLVDSGDASIGEDGRPTITFVTTEDNAFIMNTFTTTESGYKTTKMEDVKMTLSDLRITGELRTNTIGIYVKPGKVSKGNWGEEYSQATFNTEWTNVDVKDCKIVPYTVNDQIQIGSAVCIYGTVTLNNCNIIGTTWSEKTTMNLEGVNLFDMAATNSSVTIVNGGNIGNVYLWEQSKITFKGGATVNSVYSVSMSASSLGYGIVEDATINEMTIDPKSTYNPDLRISAASKIGTLTFLDEADANQFNSAYWAKVSIDENATIGKIFVGETEYDLAGFLAYKASVK